MRYQGGGKSAFHALRASASRPGGELGRAASTAEVVQGVGWRSGFQKRAWLRFLVRGNALSLREVFGASGAVVCNGEGGMVVELVTLYTGQHLPSL